MLGNTQSPVGPDDAYLLDTMPEGHARQGMSKQALCTAVTVVVQWAVTSSSTSSTSSQQPRVTWSA